MTDELTEWYMRGQLNAQRNILWTLKRMYECERKISKEQFDEISAYILSHAPSSAAYNELASIRDWNYSKTVIQ